MRPLLAPRWLQLHVVLALTSSAFAASQTLSVLVKKDDVVGAIGGVKFIENLAVNDSGSWMVYVATNNVDVTHDHAVIKNGVMILQEQTPVSAPPGDSIVETSRMNLNSAAHTVWPWGLIAAPISQALGLYHDTQLLLQKGFPTGAVGFTPGTNYTGFTDVEFNDNHQVLLHCGVDDSANPAPLEETLMMLTLDGSGALVSETKLFTRGDALPGIATETLFGLFNGARTYALNDLGHYMFTGFVTGSGTTNGFIALDGRLLAREGDVEPSTGRTIETVYGKALDLNASGEFAYRANFTGSTSDDEILLGNGTKKIARVGDPAPSVGGGFLLTSLATDSAVHVADTGEVLWFGVWNDPNTSQSSGLFLDQTLIVQLGVTTVGGLTVTSLTGAAGVHGTALSPNGRYIAFECQLTGSIDAAVLIDRGVQRAPIGTAFCFGDGSLATACPCGNFGVPQHGCANSATRAGAILCASGTTTPNTVKLRAAGLPVASLCLLLRAQTSVPAGAVFGDGVKCLAGGPFRIASPRPVGGDSSATFQVPAAASGQTRVYQVLYRDAGTFCTSSTVNSTNALSITW